MKVKLMNFLNSSKNKFSRLGHFLKREWVPVSVSFVSMVIVSMVSMVLFLSDELVDVRIDGKAINQLEYSDRYIATKNVYSLLGYDVEADPELEQFVKKNIVYKMITEEYEKILAKELGVKATPSQVEDFLSVNGYSKVLFNEDISYQMAKGDYISLMNKAAVVDKIIQSEDTLKEYYEANKELFQSSRVKQTEQLIFTDKELAERILIEVKSGKEMKDFEGEGAIYVSANVSEANTKLSSFVSGLSKGEISDVVSFGGNHFIIKSSDDSFVGSLLEFEDAKDRVIDLLVEKEGTKYYQELINNHLANKKITFN